MMMNLNEKKFFDFTSGTIVGAATWKMSSEVGKIVQGTTASNRLGNKIYIHSIEWLVKCFCNIGSMPTGGTNSRFIIWHDKEAVGTDPAALQIFTVDNMQSLRATPYLAKISVLRDMLCSQVLTTTTTAGPEMLHTFKIFPKKVINYIGNTAAVADLLKDNYGLGYSCNLGGATSIIYTTKIVFSDA